MAEYKIIRNTEELYEYLASSVIFGLDIETAPDELYRTEDKAALDVHKSHIVCVTLSKKADEGVMIPLSFIKGENLNKESVVGTLKTELFEKNEKTVVIHNAVFDLSFFYKEKIKPLCKIADTMLMSQLTLKGDGEFRQLQDSGLKTLAKTLLQKNVNTYEDTAEDHHFDELDPYATKTINYACSDADYCLQLYHLFNDWFNAYLPKHELIARMESATTPFVMMMKYNGVPVDKDYINTVKSSAEKTISELKSDLDTKLGFDIGKSANNKALQMWLFEEKELPVFKTTLTGKPSMDDESLKRLCDYCIAQEKEEISDIIYKILEYRQWQKIMTTYIEGYIKCINEVTDCIHPWLNQLGAETGRFTCKNPNLQNQGSDKKKVSVRDFFKAPEGWSLLEADYSQEEIRVVAALSHDEVLLKAYAEGKDVHALTTSAVFNISYEEARDQTRDDYKSRRRVAKAVMFGLMYGMSGIGLSQHLYADAGITITPEEGQEYIDSVLNKYKGLAVWQKMQKRNAEVTGFAQTPLGRRRYLPDVRSEDFKAKSTALRQAVNMPVQGCGADILKCSMVRLYKEIINRDDIKPVLTVHDSIVFLVKDDSIESAANLIKECMETPLPIKGFPSIPVDISIGQSYGHLEEYKFE